MTFKSVFQAKFLRRSGPIKVGLKDVGLNDWAWMSYTHFITIRFSDKTVYFALMSSRRFPKTEDPQNPTTTPRQGESLGCHFQKI